MSTTRLVVFLLVALTVLGGASFYLLRRATAAFALGLRARRVAAVVLYGALVIIALTRMMERRIPSALLDPVASVGFTIVLGAAMSAVILAVIELLIATVTFPARLLRRPAPVPDAVLAETPAAMPVAPPPVDEKTVPRRVFLAQAAAGSAIAVGGSASTYGAWRGRHDYALEEVPVRIAGLGRQLDGFTVAQLSDVHIGLFVRDFEMRAAEDLVRRAKPDLIVLTGDLLDHDPALGPVLSRLVSRLAPLARAGLVAIPGNHDYYAGLDAVRAAVLGGGGRYLVNEGVMIGGDAGFALLGLDDVMGPANDKRSLGPDFARALRSVPAAQDRPRVVLCHNPATFTHNAGKAALQLSGHTHGGQINLGVRPADYVLGYPYIAGRYELAGSQIYVNRGFGTAGPPARVGAPPEVTRLVLTSS